MNYLKEHPIQMSWFQDRTTPETVTYADVFAQRLSEEEKGKSVALTTSQLRKFFGAVKNLQLMVELNGFSESEFGMLKPKLAYAVGRAHKNNGNKECRIDDFKDVISQAIDNVMACEDKKKAFDNFINFFEAIVAYHKVYGKDT